MRSVVINEEQTKREALQQKKYKVRALIFNSEGKMILTHYEGFHLYMLPGGSMEKQDKGNRIKSLKREITQETGIEEKHIWLSSKPFMKLKVYHQNFSTRDAKFPVNRVTTTYFYAGMTDQEICLEKRELTPSEKRANHTSFFISPNEVSDLLKSNTDQSVKRQDFDREIEMCLQEFFQNKNKETQGWEIMD